MAFVPFFQQILNFSFIASGLIKLHLKTLQLTCRHALCSVYLQRQLILLSFIVVEWSLMPTKTANIFKWSGLNSIIQLHIDEIRLVLCLWSIQTCFCDFLTVVSKKNIKQWSKVFYLLTPKNPLLLSVMFPFLINSAPKTSSFGAPDVSFLGCFFFSRMDAFKKKQNKTNKDKLDADQK